MLAVNPETFGLAWICAIIEVMKLEMIPQEFKQALPVLEKIIEHGYEAYFVGGSVRDVLLGREIHDVDIATSAYPEEIKAIFPYTIDVGIEHGTVLVLAGKTEAEHYEVTTFRTESQYTDYRRPDHVDFVRDLSEDLKRRDFTINAFACGIDGEIVDCFDGLMDLKESRIRAVGKAQERFNEDALRIMRAVRFAASLDFTIEEETFVAMKSHAPLLNKISVERIFIEFDKLLQAKSYKKGLEALIQSEAWKYLPGFDKRGLEALLSELTEGFVFENSAQAWAAFMVRIDQVDVVQFLRHWKVPNDFIKDVSLLTEAYQLEQWTLESLYKFGLRRAELVDDLKIAEGKHIDKEIAKRLDAALQIHDKFEMSVSGNDLLQAFPDDIKPGPKLGFILKELEVKVVRNELVNTQACLFDYIKNNCLPRRNKRQTAL